MMELIKHLEGFFSAQISIIKTIASLIKLEANLAGLSVFPLLVNILMLLVILLTACSTTMVLIGYGLFWAFNSLLLSISLVLLINAVVLIGLLKYLTYNLKNMSFQKTREYFSRESMKNDQLKNANNETNSASGQELSLSGKQAD